MSSTLSGVDYTPLNTTLQHPASVDKYIRNKWSLVPIPPGTKGPTTKGWNLKQNALANGSTLPPGWGVGLAHAYSGTMALDIDHWERAVQEFTNVGLDLDALYDAPDAVIIDSGKQGHGKLLYKMPEGLILPSKKLIALDTFGAKYNYIDFRCGTKSDTTAQDVLPPSIHPETRQPYRWAGRGKWENLPEIPFPLLMYWQSLLTDDTIKPSSSVTPLDVNWDDVTSALYVISPDISRDEWLHVGMALFHAGHKTGDLEKAFQLWNTWSATSKGNNWEGRAKYQGTGDLVNVWKSLRLDGDVITLGTLFDMAIAGGWKRPTPDMSTMFTKTTSNELMNAELSFSPPSPEIDMSLIPPVLRQRALEVSESVGCDPLVPLFAGLGAICAAVDSRTRLELMPGFQVPPVLWLMTIGEPADKKTPGSKPMFKVLRELELEDRPRFKKALLDWDGAEAAHSSAKKVFLEYAASPEMHMGNDSIPTVPDLAAPPVTMKLTVGDITSQKLVRSAAERPRGLLCYLDEMRSWIGKMIDSRSGEDRSSWVQGFEADFYEMDRVGAGSIYCDNFAVSIYGNVQPLVFKESLVKLSSDGMLQRFIPAILSSKHTRRNEPMEEELTNNKQWNNLIRTCYALPELTYTLSPGAYELYRDFQTWYDDMRRTERVLKSDAVFMTAFGKLEGQVGRLALVFHIQTAPYEITISPETMQQVIDFTKSYVIPAIRYAFAEIGGMNKDTLEHWVMEHVVQMADKDEITLMEIKHSARRQLERITIRSSHEAAEMIKDAMVSLELCEWVTLFSSTRTNATWLINPLLKDVFKDKRDQVIAAKQARLDANLVIATKHSKTKTPVRQYAHGFTDRD